MDIGVAEIDSWHKERGYDSCGYHYVIRRNGFIEKGRDESQIGAHCKGKNSNSIGICLVGGLADDGKSSQENYTESQFTSLEELLQDLLTRYPNAEINGHRDFNSNKECPCFNIQNWWQLRSHINNHFNQSLENESKFYPKSW